jgi:hypothetical protein
MSYDTEEHAKTKWCPFARKLGTNHTASYNRTPGAMSEATTLCLGSACMAWRQSLRPTPKWRSTTVEGNERFKPETPEPARPSDIPASWRWEPADWESAGGWREPDEEAGKRRTGFCGLAGSPAHG